MLVLSTQSSDDYHTNYIGNILQIALDLISITNSSLI
jgi:hypothetical protein